MSRLNNDPFQTGRRFQDRLLFYDNKSSPASVPGALRDIQLRHRTSGHDNHLTKQRSTSTIPNGSVSDADLKKHLLLLKTETDTSKLDYSLSQLFTYLSSLSLLLFQSFFYVASSILRYSRKVARSISLFRFLRLTTNSRNSALFSR